MSRVSITTGDHVVEVADDNATAEALLPVAFAAWDETQPKPGTPIGFSGGGVGSAERAPSNARPGLFRGRAPHVTGEADKDDDTWIDVQPVGEAGDQ